MAPEVTLELSMFALIKGPSFTFKLGPRFMDSDYVNLKFFLFLIVIPNSKPSSI
jgi:hypothetical protein